MSDFFLAHPAPALRIIISMGHITFKHPRESMIIRIDSNPLHEYTVIKLEYSFLKKRPLVNKLWIDDIMATMVDRKLVNKLLENGIEPSLIPGFIRSLANACLINPQMAPCQANKRLKYLGWGDIEIDYHTLQLAITSLETKGLSELEYKSAPWYLNSFDTKAPTSAC